METNCTMTWKKDRKGITTMASKYNRILFFFQSSSLAASGAREDDIEVTDEDVGIPPLLAA